MLVKIAPASSNVIKANWPRTAIKGFYFGIQRMSMRANVAVRANCIQKSLARVVIALMNIPVLSRAG